MPHHRTPVSGCDLPTILMVRKTMNPENPPFAARDRAREAFATNDAPSAIGPYSQAIAAAGLLYVSGQLPLSANGVDMPEGIGEQARASLRNVEAIAQSAGCTLGDVVKLTIYMTDLQGFAQVNEVMASMLSRPYPARATVEVSALPRSAQIEIEAVVALPANKG